MDLYMARQPIFERSQNIFGYELLYRNGNENFFPGTDGDLATAAVINQSLFSIDAAEVTGGKRAFINFSRELLLSHIAFALPNRSIAIEILETAEIDDEIADVCRCLKQEGYMLVLDDFVYNENCELIFEFVDIVKIDLLATNPVERMRIIEKCSQHAIKILAEKVETPEMFKDAKNIGCDYFQGYFFCKPVIMVGKVLSSSQIARLRLLAELNCSEPDPVKIRRIVETEIGLAYKLLQYINSSALGVRNRIHSIDHAINMLGTKGLSQWITLVTMKGMLAGKPEELLTTVAIRAKFCELLTRKIDAQWDSDMFLVGLFSLLDVMLERPMAEILSKLPLTEMIKTALLGEENRYKLMLDIIRAYERCDWQQVDRLVKLLGVQGKEVAFCYRDALTWSKG